MVLIKFLFGIFLATMLVFFLWNIMKRIFFRPFYNVPNRRERAAQNLKKEQPQRGKGLNWDAETVDFEEIKEEKFQNKD